MRWYPTANQSSVRQRFKSYARIVPEIPAKHTRCCDSIHLGTRRSGILGCPMVVMDLRPHPTSVRHRYRIRPSKATAGRSYPRHWHAGLRLHRLGSTKPSRRTSTFALARHHTMSAYTSGKWQRRTKIKALQVIADLADQRLRGLS